MVRSRVYRYILLILYHSIAVNMSPATHTQSTTGQFPPQPLSPDAPISTPIVTCIGLPNICPDRRCETALPRLGHAIPLVRLRRRHHRPHRQVHPANRRPGLTRWMALLTRAPNSHKLGGIYPRPKTSPYNPRGRPLTKLPDRSRVQNPRAGEPIRGRDGDVADEAAGAGRAGVWEHGHV